MKLFNSVGSAVECSYKNYDDPDVVQDGESTGHVK